MTCSKIAYPSRRKAAASLRFLRARGGYDGARVYKCPTCGKHHIGRDTGYALPWWKLKGVK